MCVMSAKGGNEERFVCARIKYPDRPCVLLVVRVCVVVLRVRWRRGLPAVVPVNS